MVVSLYLVVSPGPLLDLASVVHIQGFPHTGSSFYMVSIAADKANILSFIRAVVDPTRSIWPKKAIMGTLTEEEFKEQSKIEMELSKNTAINFAKSVLGDDRVPYEISIESGEVGGPSAGLAYVLEILSRLDQDLVKGRQIACTGVVDAGGAVRAVGGIAQKTMACRQYGIDVFLVPEGNQEEALIYAGEMMVIGVCSVFGSNNFD